VNVHRDEDIFGVNDQDDTLMFDADKDQQCKEVVVEKEVAEVVESLKKTKEIAQEGSSKRARDELEQEIAKNKLPKNFNREDLEVLWRLFKDRFVKTKPVDDMDSFLMHTLKTMFEHHVEDNVWKNQQGLTKVKNWKLFDSCRFHCVRMQNILYYQLVEKTYPLTNHTLHQMFNNVKLQVNDECEMAYELVRLVKKQLKEGYKAN
nr:hypothetical protein [Tanacetum cinerariifolium]